MKAHSQTTINDRVSLSGVGVHCGASSTVTLHPAEPDTGIIFLKNTDEAAADIEVPASHRFVVATALSTVLGSTQAGSIATVEHLMASIGGLGIDNIIVEIDGDEVPIMDGSAEAFVDAIRQVGIRRQPARRRYIKVLKPVRVQIGDAVGELMPCDSRRFEVEIDFADAIIGRQAYVYDAESGDFARDLARARTFGFMSSVEQLWANGYALGASLENTVVIGDDQIVNPEGLRFADEFVRHKVLDAIGDLTLAGAPVLGHYRSYRGGHRLNCAMVEALLSDKSAWEWSTVPARREATQADVGAMLPAAALGPDVS
ncbi:UDP-3-O-acyl-N-acetylglucosamine deacetylase [Microbaculum marinum]|uniref:UDP-3-O-acyl-N-acetylglucosamine deacetylase n=1 Tax=Microbaculum marinum TaxID=1764581 RepID=A0AAW9RSB6_9HYPH